MPGFYVTYEIVTPESAEYGDAEEHGWLSPGGWRTDDRPPPISLREAVQLVGLCEDSGRWLTEVDGRENYQTGAVERRSLHPPHNISAASYTRIARIFGAAKC